jgi:hypothetical protein
MIIAVISFSSCKKMHIHAYSCNCYTCEDYFNEYGNCDGVNGTWNNGTFMSNQNPGGFMNNQNTGPCEVVCPGETVATDLLSEPMGHSWPLMTLDGQTIQGHTNYNNQLLNRAQELWNDSTVQIVEVWITNSASASAPHYRVTSVNGIY